MSSRVELVDKHHYLAKNSKSVQTNNGIWWWWCTVGNRVESLSVYSQTDSLSCSDTLSMMVDHFEILKLIKEGKLNLLELHKLLQKQQNSEIKPNYHLLHQSNKSIKSMLDSLEKEWNRPNYWLQTKVHIICAHVESHCCIVFAAKKSFMTLVHKTNCQLDNFNCFAFFDNHFHSSGWFRFK